MVRQRHRRIALLGRRAGSYCFAVTLVFALFLTGCGGGSSSSNSGGSTGTAVTASAGGPYTGVAGTAITFDGSKSTAQGTQTLTYAWNFGDSGTGTGVSPTHTYAAAGIYTVSLTVTGSSGQTATASSTAAVTAAAVLLPVASAGGPYTGTAGTAVSFDGSKSTAPAGQTLTYAWNFGDTSTGTGVSPTHAYTAAGTYTVTVTVTASGGGTATATATATIAALPVANAGGPYTGVAGTAVSFDGSKSTAPTGQTLTYAWNFGDSSTGTGVSPTHAYTTAGTYTVTLTVTASGGSTATATSTATISALPVASAGGPYSGSIGTAVSFDGSKSTVPAGQTLTYAWNFGDSSTGTGVSPTHTYTAAGTFTVTLTVTASSGGTATATSTATISALPVASAGGPYSGSIGTAVAFDGSKSTAPSGQTLTYAWNFGDSSTGTGVSPTHTYTAAGTFTVTLTITASGGATATATATATISALPVANAGGPYTGSLGTAVTFSGSKSTAPSGQTLTYAWNFGDSSTGTGVSPTHTYTAAGTFTVTLTITASGGATATATSTATISALPVASAGGPYTANAGAAVTFDGSKSTAPSGQTLTYAWSFGDSSTGTGVNPTHTYTAAGTYTVTLTITASGGATATATSTATIAALPVANLGGPYTGTVGTAITFDGSKSTAPSGQTLTYAWSFGDSSTGTGVNPTHTYTAAGTFTVTLTVTGSGGGINVATGSITVSGVTVANAGGPYNGSITAPLTFDGSKSSAPSGQTLTYAWNFGDSATGTGVNPTHTYAATGTYTVTLTVTSSGSQTATATSTATISATPAPSISSVSPASGPVGTLVTITGSNLSQSGVTTTISLTRQGGGTISAPISTASATSITFVIPAGAGTGPLVVSVGSLTGSPASPLTVTTSSAYTVTVSPATGSVIQGQSTAFSVTLASASGFSGVANLSVTGLPGGVTAAFSPVSVAAGQVSLLTITAPKGQAVSTSTLTISAAATIDGQQAGQTATASLAVSALTTTFLGRTVVDDATESPIAGVTVKFVGTDASGRATGCTGQTVSDGAGNFVLSNLPTACTGPQLISYNGLTATSPTGTFAGVNLSYTLVASQVVASPVLIHLPRIDNAETVQVQQNAATDQVFYFHSIPGVKVTVYAGTTISLDDGSQPNPFPLVALSIPLDRLPDSMPTTGMLMPFIVAFQPANAVASQPVAVNFPNSLGVAPNTHVTFVTLDPTHGYMVPYGTGTVSSDGSEFIADADPNHAGHAYGLVHFDWHGPATPPNSTVNPAPPCDCAPATAGGPVDLGTGLVMYSNNDVLIGGKRGGLSLKRSYRSLTTRVGPFGLGTYHQYFMYLDCVPLLDGQALINLVMPDGNQYQMNQAPDGTFINSTIPMLRGAILSGSIASNAFTLRFVDGTQFNFTTFSSLGQGQSFLNSIVDLNGNTTTLTLNSSQPQQITKITDPVGRSLVLTYDSSGRVTQVTDPIGRKVSYAYGSSGTLNSVTDQAGGVTKYTYDSSNNLASITDGRGVTTEQDTYNESFDGRVSQQVQADGTILKFTYLLQNPKLASSPVLQTTVTDPLGHQTVYRFDMQGFIQSVTDASGQTRTFTHDPTHFNLVSGYSGNGACPVCGDPAKGSLTRTFDAYGNVVSQTDALGNTTTKTYDTRFNKISSMTDPLGNTTVFTYDSNGNPTSVKDANGHTVKLSYDAFGEVTQVVDAAGGATAIAYDAFGNVSSVTNALGKTTNFISDGVSRLTQVQDALGRKGLTAYDALDRITSVTDPKGNVTQLAFDAIGELLSVTDPKGGKTTFAYDSRGRLTTRTSPLGSAETYAYDADSNIASYTDRRGQVSKFSYDVLDRPVTATYQDSTVTNTYDSAGRLLGVVDSMDGSFDFKYDAAGRLLQQSSPTGAVKYVYDALGRVASEQVVGQNATAYAYDSVGNMLSASMNSAGVTYAYDARNLPLTLSRTNGVVSTFSYDSLGELLSLVHAKGASALNSQAYTYDAVGNRSTVTNDLSKPITTQSSTSKVDVGNELTTSGGATYTYDANGNRLTQTIAGVTTTYTWDSRNRLTSVADSSGNKTSMAYGSSQNLLGVSTTSGSATTTQQFVLDSLSNIISVTNAGAASSVLAGRGLDQIFASVPASGSPVFGVFDAQGNPLGVTDTTGALSSPLSYDPYGVVTGTPSAQFPFVYANHIPIAGSVMFSRARYYDAAAGRFLSEDPLGIRSGDANPYRYALDNPVNYIDPTGLIAGGINYGVGGGLGVGKGAAGQLEGGAGVFLNQDKSFKPNLGAYGEGGVFLGGGGPSSNVGLPSQNSTDFAVGVSIPSPGVGGFLSNARTPCDLDGDFSATNLTVAVVNISFQTGYAADGRFIWSLSVSLGEGLGLALSHYTTNTFKTFSLF